MGENIVCYNNSPSSDLVAVKDGCRSELTRTGSDSSGGITIDTSLNDQNAPLDQSAEWTNDRHNAYLGLLESSFVQQLNRSKRSRGCRSVENMCWPFSSQTLPVKRCRQKIRFEENDPLFNNAADSYALVKSPWIRRFTSAGKLETSTSSFDPQVCDEGFHSREDRVLSCEWAASSEQHRDYSLYHQNSAGSTREDSGQNFADEDERHNKPSCEPMAKRSKTAAIDASSNDQVVPLGNLHILNVPATSHKESN